MLNYMKSEWYRVTRGKSFYAAIGILGGLVVLMNIVLALGGRYIPDFRYGTFRFSLNCFTGAIYSMVVMGGVVPGCLFVDDRKNGVLKNAVSYGISRDKILVGKFMVSFLFTFLILCAVVGIYLGSARLLLPNPEWEPVWEMLKGIGAALPSAAASLVLILSLGVLYQKEMTMAIWWAVVIYLVPTALSLIGIKVEILRRISSWMPCVFFQSEAIVRYDSYDCLWDTPEGLFKCIFAGLIGIVVFSVFGIWRFRKQEL